MPLIRIHVPTVSTLALTRSLSTKSWVKLHWERLNSRDALNLEDFEVKGCVRKKPRSLQQPMTFVNILQAFRERERERESARYATPPSGTKVFVFILMLCLTGRRSGAFRKHESATEGWGISQT